VAVPAFIGGRGGSAVKSPAAPAASSTPATPTSGLSSANQQLYGQDVSTVESDLANDNFTGAWSTALASSGLFDTKGYSAAMQSETSDPLLGALENNAAALDPNKQWTSAETNNFYSAFDAQGAYHGQQVVGQGGGVEALGKDPSGLWGNAASIANGSDAKANETQVGNAPDVARFVGARPSQSFLSKYGGDIAMLAAAVAAPELIGAIAPAIGGIGAGAVVGGGLSAATDAITGRPLTAGSVLGGALGGAAGAGLTGLAGNAINGATGLGGTVSTGLAGAGIGATRTALTGGNVGIGALTGGIGGAVQGSGVGNTLKTGLTGAGFNGAASNALVNGGINYAVGGATGLATGALMGGGSGGSNLGNAAGALSQGAQGAQGNNGNMANTDNTLAQTITGALPGVLQGAAGVYGSQNAAEKLTQADQNAIGTQQTNLGNINSIWSTQQNLGQGAQTALGTALGTNGQPADYSGFQNMPGYQFAVQQGTQAIQRQAASMGNAYTPNTAAAVGQYVTGTASQDYNTYISQLMGAAGLGSTANTQLQSGNQSTANNISQLQQNQGYAQASGVSGASNAVGGLFGANGAGTSLLGAASKFLSGGGGNGGGGGGGSGSSNGGGGSGSSANSTGTGDGSFGSGVDPSTGQPWVDPNMQAPSFDTSSVGMPTMPSIDTNNYDFGGGLDYSNSTNDMFSGSNFLGDS
jgi:hypothetical protein